ncbi:hypothetical protein NBRC116602_03790 [Hyphomicrobiales bacterium 4NK60-0047b]
MTFDPDEAHEYRILTTQELGILVKRQRKQKQWTQSTLAELSRLSDRTVQRVESGQSASYDTRRAIASGFGLEDLDIFNKTFPILSDEKFKTYMIELEKSTTVINITQAQTSRELRTMIEGTQSYVSSYIGETPPQAQELFAELVDNLSDYNDIRDCYNESQRLHFDAFLDDFITKINDQGCKVGVGKHHGKIRFRNDSSEARPMSWTNIFLILSPTSELPSKFRVPKEFAIR